MKIAYLACSGILDSVFDSQVIGFLDQLKERDVGADLFAARGPESIFSTPFREKTREIREKFHGKFHHIWYLRHVGNWTTCASRVSFLRKIKSSQDYHLIHCRGSYSGYVAVQAKKVRLPVVTDVRGIISDEAQARKDGTSLWRWVKSSSWRSEALRELERVSVEKASAVSCVSSALRDYLLERYSLNPENIIVVPCCVDVSVFRPDEEARQRVREELGVSDKKVFLYVGSAKVWQIPKTIAYLFRCASEQDERSHLLVLTQDPDVMRECMAKEGVDLQRVTVMRVSHSAVGRYIRAANVGLLLREKSPVNAVASPTKFGEYVASGVPVIASCGIGDTEAQIQDNGLGWLIEDVRDRQLIKEKTKEVLEDLNSSGPERERIAGAGRSLFGWGNHISKVIALYDRLGQPQ